MRNQQTATHSHIKEDPSNKPNSCPNNNAISDDDYDGYNAAKVTSKKSNAKMHHAAPETTEQASKFLLFKCI